MTLETYNDLINRIKNYPIGTGVAILNTKKSNSKILQTLKTAVANYGVEVTKAETTDFSKVSNLKEAENYLNSKGDFGTPIGYAIILVTPRDNIYSKMIYNNLEW